MKDWTYKVTEIKDYAPVLLKLSKLSSNYRIITLLGDLGAGKTTLVKSWLAYLGVTERVTSPTFSIVNEYRLERKVFYHMDLYRLKSSEELGEIGIEEYIFGDSICLIEWPELIYDFLDQSWLEVRIENIDGIREVTIKERSH